MSEERGDEEADGGVKGVAAARGGEEAGFGHFAEELAGTVVVELEGGADLGGGEEGAVVMEET
ncbi:hypothetical protein KSC_083250 [Ktedonobacter sp. SOSP1-52]|nr:hypothetical protein KSC_083250 [Ktedonobacter sp. SOSP1-52]